MSVVVSIKQKRRGSEKALKGRRHAFFYLAVVVGEGLSKALGP